MSSNGRPMPPARGRRTRVAGIILGTSFLVAACGGVDVPSTGPGNGTGADGTADARMNAEGEVPNAGAAGAAADVDADGVRLPRPTRGGASGSSGGDGTASDTGGRGGAAGTPGSRGGADDGRSGGRASGPGTICGTVRTTVLTQYDGENVEVMRGTVDCDEAFAVVSTYADTPIDGNSGNMNFREINGWLRKNLTVPESDASGFQMSCWMDGGGGSVGIRNPSW